MVVVPQGRVFVLHQSVRRIIWKIVVTGLPGLECIERIAVIFRGLKPAVAVDGGNRFANADGIVLGEGVACVVLKRLAEEGVRSKKLTVSHAFHSPLMEPMLEAFAKAASKVAFQPPRIALISNVTGLLARRGEVEQASYWVRHVREAVQFLSGMRTLEERGCRVFLEVGPSPTLLGMGRRCVSDDEAAAFLQRREQRRQRGL